MIAMVIRNQSKCYMGVQTYENAHTHLNALGE